MRGTPNGPEWGAQAAGVGPNKEPELPGPVVRGRPNGWRVLSHPAFKVAGACSAPAMVAAEFGGRNLAGERRRWDLNPWTLAGHTISSRADSAALALLRELPVCSSREAIVSRTDGRGR